MSKSKNKKSKAKAEKASTETESPSTPEFKFGVDDLANKLELKAASVRVKLRAAGIKPDGRSYGWNSQKAFDGVVKQLKNVETKKAA